MALSESVINKIAQNLIKGMAPEEKAFLTAILERLDSGEITVDDFIKIIRSACQQEPPRSPLAEIIDELNKNGDRSE